MSPVADYYRRQREEHERAIDRNCRLLELARHNGFEIDISPARSDRGPLWMVPLALQPMVGCMGAIVR